MSLLEKTSINSSRIVTIGLFIDVFACPPHEIVASQMKDSKHQDIFFPRSI